MRFTGINTIFISWMIFFSVTYLFIAETPCISRNIEVKDLL